MAKNWVKHDQERDRLMALVPETLPPEVDQWMVDVCLAMHHYMLYDNRFGYRYCTRCQAEIDRRWILRPRHNEPIECPVCGADLTAVCVGKYRRNPVKADNYNIRVMQRTTEGIVVRRFAIIRECYDWHGQVKVRWLWDELQRIFNDGTKARRYRQFYGYRQDRPGREWIESKQTEFATHNLMGWVTHDEEYDYVDNIREVIADTCWQYSALAKRDTFHINSGVLDYFAGWIKPVEMMEKTGWDKLAADVLAFDTRYLKPEAQSLDKFLRLPKQHIAFARKSNLDIQGLEVLRMVVRAKEPIPTAHELEYFAQYREYYRRCRSLAPDMRITEWMRYGAATYLFSQYYDYLRFCRDLGYDMTDREILFPKDLHQAHDREMVRVKVLAHEKENAAIAGRYQADLTAYGFHAGGLLIRPPVDGEEIMREGAKLHHCVGTYVDQVARNQTTILVVRQKECPEEPFFTAEWRENRLIQIRGDHNKPPTPEVAEFIKAWENRKKQKQKIAVKAAV